MAYLAHQQGDPVKPVQPVPEAIHLVAWYNALRQSLLTRQYRATPIPNGYMLYFQGEAEIRAYRDDIEDRIGEDLKAFIVLEARRCPFLTLTLERQGTLYVLNLTGPEGTQAWLAADYGLE